MDDAYAQLRGQALDVVELGMPPPPREHPDVFAVLVDLPGDRPGSFATVVAMGDGTSSLYSSGESTIGIGRYEGVRAANRALLGLVNQRLGEFGMPSSGAFPPPRNVRIHVVTA